MNPQGGQNPYLAAIQGGAKPPMAGGQNPMLQHAVQPGAQPPMPQGPQGPAGPGATPQGPAAGGPGAGAAQPTIETSTTPGQNPGSTEALLKALTALNSVITDSDDPAEVDTVRQIIILIQKLIHQDQQKQGSKDSALAQAMQGASQFPPQHLQGGAPMQ